MKPEQNPVKLAKNVAHHTGANRNIVDVGHSLGAGAAVLLSIMLKPHYPKVSTPSIWLVQGLPDYLLDWRSCYISDPIEPALE